MSSEKELIKRIENLEARNKRVEADKAWEGSWSRKLAIIVLTYFVIASYLYLVVKIDPWVNAVVPVVGFFLSTLTIGLLKKIWIDRR